MEPGPLTTDGNIICEWGFFTLNATILYTWIVMAILVVGSWLVTRRLSTGRDMSRWQNVLEVVVGFLRREIRLLSNQPPDPYLPFVGTIFIFIAVSSILEIVPGFSSPAGSLSTTTALAVCVLIAVPVYGIANQGVLDYLKNYLRPSPFMLPFNVIGEVSRTIALAFRLFGNVMSGAKVVAVLLLVAPVFFPILLKLFGVLIGMIQAYIFAVLAMVYIASGLRGRQTQQRKAVERAARAEASKALGSETHKENQSPKGEG